MPNRNYIKGVKKERAIVNAARELGLVALRSAGSHSPIDVVIIDHQLKLVRLIQCKPSSFSTAEIQKLYEKFNYLNGTYEVKFDVR